ncbi:hypothetical protein Glove_140g154 [Diversispora epigaea]|uniref:Uncharacterized protein n=1 Tax=Diversispora epigaea TaxID=1348612 RepID=A0A397IXT4_9GLOM|nr:hypothetical protein Glove_140g154 [Diversispora epigaea]
MYYFSRQVNPIIPFKKTFKSFSANKTKGFLHQIKIPVTQDKKSFMIYIHWPYCKRYNTIKDLHLNI